MIAIISLACFMTGIYLEFKGKMLPGIILASIGAGIMSALYY